MTEALRPSDRVRRASEFQTAQRGGARVHTPHFTLVLSKSPVRTTRLGITVSKKVSPKAVLRNRVKRMVREVWRRHRALAPAGMDILFVAKKGSPELRYTDVLAEWTEARPAMADAVRRRPR